MKEFTFPKDHLRTHVMMSLFDRIMPM